MSETGSDTHKKTKCMRVDLLPVNNEQYMAKDCAKPLEHTDVTCNWEYVLVNMVSSCKTHLLRI